MGCRNLIGQKPMGASHLLLRQTNSEVVGWLQIVQMVTVIGAVAEAALGQIVALEVV